jgi:hypothetical protein
VHNFACAVHFCDNKTYDVEYTDFNLVPRISLG